MATVIAQAQRLSAIFSKLAQRFYDARLAKAEREVKRPTSLFWQGRPIKKLPSLQLA